MEPRGSFGVGLWKYIRKEAQQLKQKCWVMGVVLYFGKIGGVGRVRCVSFPTLYVVAASKGAIVGVVWETTRGGG